MKRILIFLIALFLWFKPGDAQTITGYDYWFDNDFGNAISTTTNQASVNFSTNLATTGLNNGFHFLHFRAKDNNGRYSTVLNNLFYKAPTYVNTNNAMTDYEYWFDSNYSGRVTGTIGSTVEFNLNTILDESGLTLGYHYFHIRAKDERGKWTPVITSYVNRTTGGSAPVIKYEYWFDMNYAGRVSQTISSTLQYDLNTNLQTSSVSPGTHYYHVRFLDAFGKWSSVESNMFRKEGYLRPAADVVTGYRYWFNNNVPNTVTVHLPTPSTTVNLVTTFDATIFADSGNNIVHYQFMDTLGYWSSVVTDTFNRQYYVTAAFTSNSPTCLGNAITFTNTSHDVDTYHWDFGDNSTSTDQNPIHYYASLGTYTVTLTIHNNATNSDNSISHDVTVNGPPTPVITAPSTTLACNGGHITLDAGSGYASYYWYYSGETTETIDVTSAGIYYVSVVDMNGCSSGWGSITINNPTAFNITVTANGATTICHDGSVVLDAGSYSAYHWNTNASTETVTALGINGSNNYYVTVTDVDGCIGTGGILVIVNSIPNPTITPSGSTTFCVGGSLTLNAGTWSSYMWGNGATTQSITALDSGTYCVTVTDNIGCPGSNCIDLATYTAPPVAIEATTYTPHGTHYYGVQDSLHWCNDGSSHSILTATAGVFNYLWSDGSSSASIDATTTGSYCVTITDVNGCTNTTCVAIDYYQTTVPVITINGSQPYCSANDITLDAGSGYSYYLWNNIAQAEVITVTSSDTYSVYVEDVHGCSSTASIDITINQSPSVSITPDGPTEICEGGSIGLDAGSWDNYSWSNGETSEAISVTTTGTYSVTITDANGCTGSANISVIINGNPVPTLSSSSSTSFCDGGSVQLLVDNSNQYSSIVWTDNGTDSDTVVNTAGTYCVTVTNAQGCTGTACSDVIVYSNPVVDITSATPASFCEGGSVTLDAGAGYASYHWTINNSTNETLTTSTSGTYFVHVIDTNGCAGMDSIVVTANANPHPQISFQFSNVICDQGPVSLNAGTYASYEWSNGSTDAILNDFISSDATYCVTVLDDYGCIGSDCIDVNTYVSPTCSVTADGPITFDQGGSVTVHAGSWASYDWSTGENSEMITITESGHYCVTITDDNGCSCVSCIDVTVIPVIQCNIFHISPTTFCEGGSVGLNAGIWSSYSWSTGETTQTITASSTGHYCVTITDSTNTSCVACINVTANANPSVQIFTDTPTEFCGSGSVNLDAGHFVSYDSYSWSTGEATNDIQHLITHTTTYSVTVTDANGCTDTDEITATVNPLPVPTINANGPTTFCDGGSVILVAGNFAAYQWSTGETEQLITVSTSGTYSLTVTSFNTGCTNTASRTVKVNQNPVPSISGTTSICDGNSSTLDAGTWASFSWSTGNTDQSIAVSTADNYCVTITDNNGCSGSACVAVAVNSNPTPSVNSAGPSTFCQGISNVLSTDTYAAYIWNNGAMTNSISPDTSGNYCVTVTDNNGCMGVACMTITVIPTPNPTISPSGPLSFCDGGSVDLDAGVFASYNWNTGATTESITAFGSQPYCVTVTDQFGCIGSSCQNVTVFSNPIPNIDANGPTTFCSGGSVTLSTGVYTTYSWSNGGTNASIVVTSSGNYTVTVTSGNGCSNTASMQVTVNPSVTASITPNGPTTFCQGGSVMLDAGGVNSSYHWSTGASSQTITAVSAGSYSVTVTNAFGCSGTASIIVAVSSFATPTVTTNGPSQFCTGSSVTLSTGVYNSYTWSNGATTQSINATTSGTYVVTVSNGGNCTGTAQRTVTAYISPVPNILPSGPTSFCAGGSVAMHVGATFPSYVWSSGETTQAIVAFAGGDYIVTVTNANGCTGTSSVTVTILPNITPTITITGNNVPCTGGSRTLNAGSYSSYLWSTGGISQSINVSTSGTYSVTVANTGGCSGTASIAVTISSPPVPVITSNTGTYSFCTGGSLTLNTGTFDLYNWSNGTTTQSNIISAAGTYVVTVTNAAGCSGTATKNVTTLVNPAPNITVTGNFCNTGTAHLTVAAFTSFLWSTAQTTQAIDINASGTYIVTVTNSNGCTGSAQSIQSNACVAPTIGSVTNIALTSAMANWSQPVCFYNYTIQISRHGLNAWTQFTFAANSHYTFSQLAHATDYDWQIRTNCDAAQTNVSPWSAIGQFTTLGPREASMNGISAFSVYPNPANDEATVRFYSDNDNTPYTLRLTDMTGRTVFTANGITSEGDNQFEMNLKSIAKGIYLVELQNGDAMHQAKIVVQ